MGGVVEIIRHTRVKKIRRSGKIITAQIVEEKVIQKQYVNQILNKKMMIRT